MNFGKNTSQFTDAARCVTTHRAAQKNAGEGRERVTQTEMPTKTDHAIPTKTPLHARQLLWLIGRLFPPGRAIDVAITKAGFEAPPEEVWQKMVFYEEVSHRPPLLLRMFLPSPMKTQGNGKRVGTTVECSYSRGSLKKRITVLERPRLVRFRVIEQHIGIERCVTTVEGSYEIRGNGSSSEVALTTKYRGHLRPRWLWRPLERLIAHQLHCHILAGMGASHILPGKTPSI